MIHVKNKVSFLITLKIYLPFEISIEELVCKFESTIVVFNLGSLARWSNNNKVVVSI